MRHEQTQTASTTAPAMESTRLTQGEEVPLIGPPGAKPGECYARVFNPARYETRPEQVVKTAATEKVEITPAKFEETDQQVMVKPATTRLEVVPAVYETVDEQVMVEPARTVTEEVPAQYESVTERVIVKPAVWAWKKASEGAHSNITRVDERGEVLCLVEVPAEYKTVTTQRVKTPATTREREIPAVYKTVQRQVLKTPATTREVQVPAEYTTVKVQRMVTPAQRQTVQVPAEYETMQRTVLASPAKEEWRQVLCDANATQQNVRALQDALRTAGYDPGPSTGSLNASTMRALRDYQAARNLPVDRGDYVNLATVQSLGVNTGSAAATADTNAQESGTAGSAAQAPMETQPVQPDTRQQ